MVVVDYKVFHFINNEDQEALGYKILWRTIAIASHREEINSWSLYLCVTNLKMSLVYV